jgi:hypothetical protein
VGYERGPAPSGGRGNRVGSCNAIFGRTGVMLAISPAKVSRGY